MSNKFNSKKTRIYQIKIKGYLDNHWSEWFDGLTITQDEEGNTLLIGPVIDDAVLHSLLKKVRDLGMPLLSVNRVYPDQSDEKNKSDDIGEGEKK